MADAFLDKFTESMEEIETVAFTGKKLRIGLIGTGGICSAHVRAYKKFDDVEIVAACDIIPGKAAKFCAKEELENVKCYDGGHKEMLDDESLELDAVSICTYNCTHAESTVYALNKGVHVLLEKPMAVTLEEGVEMMKAEKASGKIFSIGFQPRLDANMQMIKKICESGALGKIYYIQTGGGRRRGIPTPAGTTFIEKDTAGIGALGDIGCYSLDMCLNAIGYPKPITVTGYKSSYFGKNPDYYKGIGHPEYADKFGVDDFAAGFIRLEGDIIIDFRIAWAMNINTPGDTIILGTEGGLRIPSTDCWNGTVGGPMTLYREICGVQTETVIPIVENKGAFTNCFDMKVRSFIDAIRNGGTAPVPSSQIIINQAIIDGICRSAEVGHELEITIPEI